MGKKLVLEEISPGVFCLKKTSGERYGNGGLARFIGEEIVCSSEENLVDKVYNSLSHVYSSSKGRLQKKLRKKAAEIVDDYSI